jgi:hypothetical protein
MRNSRYGFDTLPAIPFTSAPWVPVGEATEITWAQAYSQWSQAQRVPVTPQDFLKAFRLDSSR